MTLAASATEHVKVGTGICLVIQRDPIILAKETATIDLISKGRLIFGVGAGWLEPEITDHGVVYRTRWQLLREQLCAIKEIWTTAESAFHGRYVNFDTMRAFPKPSQHPHPPIIMGGSGEKSIELAAELCDGWAPAELEWPRARERIAELRRKAASLGRESLSLEISLFERAIPDKNDIAEMEAAGVKRIVLTIGGQSRDQALPTLDLLAGLAG